MEAPIKPSEAAAGVPELPADGGFPKRGGFRGRGGPMRGGPLRGRGGPGGFPGRGGMPMRGPMMRGGPPGRGALRPVAPGGFPPRGRGGPPGRGRMDIGHMREGRGGMFRGRGGRGGLPGRGGPPGGMPRGFGPPRPGGPPRGPLGGPMPRGAVMSRPPRSVPPAPPQAVPPLGGPPERFPLPAGGPPPKRGPPPPAAGPPQVPGPAQLVKRPRYDTPAYSNGYAPPPSSYSNPQLDNYSAQGGVAYGGNTTYGSGGQYQASYNNYPPAGSPAYQAGSGAYPSYSAQPGYEATTDYSHNPYPASGTDERYSNPYGNPDYTAYNKPTNPEAYSYGGPTAYTAPQGGYDERAYSGVGAAYDANQVYGGNPATYAAKPEYGKYPRY